MSVEILLKDVLNFDCKCRQSSLVLLGNITLGSAILLQLLFFRKRDLHLFC